MPHDARRGQPMPVAVGAPAATISSADMCDILSAATDVAPCTGMSWPHLPSVVAPADTFDLLVYTDKDCEVPQEW
jgi:hypothetical protein